MNLKPLLIAALIATGSLSGYAQQATPTPTVSEAKTKGASLDKQISAFESTTDAATAATMFTQIKGTMKEVLHAAKRDMAAMELQAETGREVAMANFSKLETAYFDISKNADLVNTDKPALVTKLKAFTALLK